MKTTVCSLIIIFSNESTSLQLLFTRLFTVWNANFKCPYYSNQTSYMFVPLVGFVDKGYTSFSQTLELASK